MSTVANQNGLPFILERVEDPDSEPVTLTEMKTHLRAYSSMTSDDALITGLITAAREWAEDLTGRALIDQTWRITVNPSRPLAQRWPNAWYYEAWQWWCQRNEILLRRSPVIAISSFVSVDSAGAETAIDTSAYLLCEANSKRPRVAAVSGATWGSGTFKIQFRAGFLQTGSPTIGEVPERFKQAIKLHAEAHYDRDPKTMQTYLDAAEALIARESVDSGFA